MKIYKKNKKRKIKREISILELLQNCDHVVRLLDYEASDNGYIKYELLSENLYEARKGLSENDIKQIFEQLLTAISEIHSHGVVHCDIKPENIMIQRDCNGINIKLIDFGESLFSDELLNNNRITGTINYRSPEDIIGAQLDCRIDYWAAGCTIMELLLGRMLFNPRRDNRVFMHGHLLGEMIVLFGDFEDTFIESGVYSKRYFDLKSGNTFLFKHLLGVRCSLYKLLLKKYPKDTAKYWSDAIAPLFERPYKKKVN